MNLLLAFHDPNFMPFFVLMLFAGMPLVLFVVARAIYIAVRRPTRQILQWAGGILVVCLAVWPVAYWSSSMFLEIAMMATTFPFGMALGFLHGDLWYFMPRDMILGQLNSAYHPITPHIFEERAIINAAAVVWILDWRGLSRRKHEEKSIAAEASFRQSEFAGNTLL